MHFKTFVLQIKVQSWWHTAVKMTPVLKISYCYYTLVKVIS